MSSKRPSTPEVPRDRLPEEFVLGIDPGSLTTGYALIAVSQKTMKAVDFGCIRPKMKILSQRYRYIFEGLTEICKTYKPTAISVEEQYVHKNVNSALKLGMAKGAALIAASLHEIPIFSYAPSTLKKAVTGHGRASKYQIQKMCQHLLSLSSLPEPEDAADALALALCHIRSSQHPLFKKAPI